MGHKEQLLEGAKKCLVELGYGRTTARDIVKASNTNLASIGYHFGSKDALLAQAMMELVEEWGEKFARAAREGGAKTSEAKFSATWKQILMLFETDRAVMLASADIAMEAPRSDELKAVFTQAWPDARASLPDDFLLPGHVDAKTRTAVGGLLLAMISGMTVQYLIDPKGAPSADDLTLAMKTIAKAFADKGKPG